MAYWGIVASQYTETGYPYGDHWGRTLQHKKITHKCLMRNAQTGYEYTLMPSEQSAFPHPYEAVSLQMIEISSKRLCLQNHWLSRKDWIWTGKVLYARGFCLFLTPCWTEPSLMRLRNWRSQIMRAVVAICDFISWYNLITSETMTHTLHKVIVLSWISVVMKSNNSSQERSWLISADSKLKSSKSNASK